MAVRKVFCHMRFTPTQKMRMEPTIERLASAPAVMSEQAHEGAHDKGRDHRCERIIPRLVTTQSGEILRKRNVTAEVQNVVEQVGVEVPLSVEVAQREPLRLENLVGRRA